MTEPVLTDTEVIDDFLDIARYDWLVTRNYNRLHWADLTPGQLAYVPEYWGVPVPVKLSCGRTAVWVGIPGVFTRMGAMRCTGCCRATGMPQGKGSPKNDDACRAFLGMPTKEKSAAEFKAAMDAQESGGDAA